jgi:16S rRNA (cytidine1402-2'-O)-methyltransferase
MTNATANRIGTLYLIPTSLTDPLVPDRVLPRHVIATTLSLNHFIAENAKTARAFLKALGIERPLAEINIVELNKHATELAHTSAIPPLLAAPILAPLLAGHDVGLVSEAGAPAVADPGADIVALAHRAGITVVPLVGPSSLLLGLMASGLNGQKFAFHGYLPTDKLARSKAIVELERESRQRNMTQMFIETPYRNHALWVDLVATLAPTTRLCVATDLTGAMESIVTYPIAKWRQTNKTLEKQPTLFLMLA